MIPPSSSRRISSHRRAVSPFHGRCCGKVPATTLAREVAWIRSDPGGPLSRGPAWTLGPAAAGRARAERAGRLGGGRRRAGGGKEAGLREPRREGGSGRKAAGPDAGRRARRARRRKPAEACSPRPPRRGGSRPRRAAGGRGGGRRRQEAGLLPQEAGGGPTGYGTRTPPGGCQIKTQGPRTPAKFAERRDAGPVPAPGLERSRFALWGRGEPCCGKEGETCVT